MAITPKEQLKDLLSDLFQLNHTDLDFGIYRILNLKATEVTQFLDVELDGVVEGVKTKIAGRGATEAKAALAEAQQLLKSQFGVDFDQPDDVVTKVSQYGQLPIFQEPYQRYLNAKQQLGQAQMSADTERDIYNRLYQFFERYYEEGDFITKPRAGRDTYLIPYNGEEVKLYWANYDQYYIKTGDSFRNYVFTNTSPDLALHRTVEFRLRNAETSLNNNREEKGRLFIPAGLPDSPDWFSFADGRLTLWFEYRVPTPDDVAVWEIKPAQRTADKGVVAKLLTLLPDRIGQTVDAELIALYQSTRKRGKDTRLPAFQYHLERFMAVNKFDYFIHKDLRGFLRRELDFFLKSEVLALNFLDPTWTDADVQTSIGLNVMLASAIRQLALTIIDFLGELEDFQKRLFEKRKFVVQADYCLTLDRIPVTTASLAANGSDRNESLQEAIFTHILTDPDRRQLTDWQTLGFMEVDTAVDDTYLLEHDKLVLDTAFLPDPLKWQLLAALDHLDSQTNGLLINSENWQALNFLKPKYRGQVKCIYIDPPYNTDASTIMYKNDYRNSSWISLMDSRLELSKQLLEKDGLLCATIDDFQQKELSFLLESVFSQGGLAGTVAIRNNPSGRPTQTGFALAHEYGIFARNSAEAIIGRSERSEEQLGRFSETDEKGVYELRNLRREGSNSEREKRRKLHYPIYITDVSFRIPELRWDEDTSQWISQELPLEGETVILPIDDNGIERTWRWGINKVKTEKSEVLVRRIRNGKLGVYIKYRPSGDGAVTPTIWADSKYSATEHGTALLKKLFANPAFSYPKSIYAVEDSLTIMGLRDDSGTALDFFAGSGTTGHAVINLNRKDEGDRKYILVEMGQYFDTVTKPRIQKVIYSDKWKDGKPTADGEGTSHLFQYLRLEQYEDTLNNIEFRDAVVPGSELSFMDKIRYSLDYGTRASGSLLNPDQFMRPFGYTLRTIRQNEIRDDQPVDLITTFNYLLGLRVVRYHVPTFGGRDYRVVVGQKGLQAYVIIWREVIEEQHDFTAERDWVLAQPWYDADALSFANADNGFGARAIEAEFGRLLWDAAV